MKLQIDTKAKIIRLEDKVLLKELVTTLEKLLPKKEWQAFTLETNTVINNWNSPVIIEEYRPFTYPWYQPAITCYSGTRLKDGVSMELATGTYNVEIK